jgi:lipopolysaccharide export system permease protein
MAKMQEFLTESGKIRELVRVCTEKRKRTPWQACPSLPPPVTLPAMRLLDRYLLREFLVPLFFCLGGFLIFWVAVDLSSEIGGMQKEGLRAAQIAQYYLYKTPSFLIMVMPVGLMLATLYTLTNHARYNEITAIRAAGVSLTRLCLPYLAVGVLATVALFALNEFVVPQTEDIADQLHSRYSQRYFKGSKLQPIKTLAFVSTISEKERRYWVIGVYNQQTGEMTRPHFDWTLPDGSSVAVDAERATYSNGVWTFFNAQEKRISATNAISPKAVTHETLAFTNFSETPDRIRSEIFINDHLNTTSNTRRADIPLRIIVNYLWLHPNPEAKIRPWVYTKLHGRFAGPVACLVVVLVAIPFAAASGRRNVYVGVAASILIFFTYYVLQQLGFAFGEAGRVPPWLGAWLPNLAFAVGSLWAIARVR